MKKLIIILALVVLCALGIRMRDKPKKHLYMAHARSKRQAIAFMLIWAVSEEEAIANVRAKIMESLEDDPVDKIEDYVIYAKIIEGE